MKNLLLIPAIALSIIACDNSKKSETPVEEAAMTHPADPNVNIGNNPQPVMPATPGEVTATPSAATTPPAAGTPTPGAPAVTAATPPGMNPPHGQPGHNCDIAVGAPLNSAKGSSPAQPIRVNPSDAGGTQTIEIPANNPTPVQVQAPPSGPTPAGMNPPHGQPGHDCAIPVGAPLKKK